MAHVVCNDRFHARTRTGTLMLAPPTCSPLPHQACREEPNRRRHTQRGVTTPYPVCLPCFNHANPTCNDNEHDALDAIVCQPNPFGGPLRFIVDPRGIRSLLCQFCEADEVELYRRRVASGVAPSPLNRNGWVNTCTCHSLRINIQPGPHPMLPPFRYCVRCRSDALTQVRIESDQNKRHLVTLARGNNGALNTADWDLTDRRNVGGFPLACRCGRDSVVATRTPRVTFCTCCNGVQVDDSQVTNLRQTAQRTALAKPLMYTSAAFNLAGHTKINVLFNQVVRCNNKRN